MRFYLIDHDRLEVGNVVRHVAGLSHVGMYKTKAMAQIIKDKNPYAEIQTLEEKVCWENIEKLRKIVQWADIVVCATDNRPSRLITNRLAVEEKKPCVFPGAFRRAYGGQIIFVHPQVFPCYQCFCTLLPEQSGDEEISNPGQAEGLAYTDRPVPIEPGFSTDIAPISLMAVKLLIQELLKGTQTTLRSLDDDLVAPGYLWLNRREPGTQYEKLGPLEFNLGGMHILRWYGIDVKRHPGCPVCGDFEGEVAKREGLQLTDSGEPVNALKG
jgi:molybdopterin/thiamine biosynthesis adenylyltransferase